MSKEHPTAGKQMLPRSPASDYLFTKHHIKQSPQTLARKACEGRGPRYYRFGNHAMYTTDDLDDYANSLKSPRAYSSTSDADAAA